MKKILFPILTIALIATTVSAQTLDRSIRPKPGPAPEIKLGKTETFTLPNGLRVFVVENHKLPTVEYSIELDVKPALEGDMAGYRDMMSELLVSGTKSRSKDKLSAEIDFIGANIDASDKGISASSLKKHQAKLLELMSDITLNADFKQEELDKIKTRTLSGLQTSKNEPDAMLRNVSAAVNFGKNHPYGEITTEESVKAITLDRCRKYYATYFHPNVAYLAIVGDITLAEVKPLIEKYFGSWEKADVPVANYSIPPVPTTARVVFVPRDGAVQSVINVTYPVDLKPGAPDAIKASVANTILGGGSQGRLFLNLREKHGWTYGSYSTLRTDELMGNFTAYAKCRNIVSDSSVGQIVEEMKRLQNEKIAGDQLQNTINYLSGNFAIGLEDPARIAQFAINIERYNMPKDYYQNYLKNLAAVTPEDVQVIATKYIHPDQANIVVVGSKAEVANKLAVYAKDGRVEMYDNYGREIKTAAAPQSIPANMTAADVWKKYIAAVGGEKAIAGLKDIKVISEGEIQGTTLSITEMKKSPLKLKQMIQAKGMTLQQVVLNGDKGYQMQQGQKSDLAGDDLKSTQQDADLQADIHQDKYGIKRTLKGMEDVNGASAYMLEVEDSKGKKSIEYYDATSFLLVKHVEDGSVTEFADYKEVPNSGGYKIPHTVTIPLGPGMTVATKVKTAEVNKNIPDTEFQ